MTSWLDLDQPMKMMYDICLLFELSMSQIVHATHHYNHRSEILCSWLTYKFSTGLLNFVFVERGRGELMFVTASREHYQSNPGKFSFSFMLSLYRKIKTCSR